MTSSEEPTGFRIEAVTAASPAEQAGLRPGDVIVQVEGQPANSIETLRETVRRSRDAGKFTVVVDRYGVHFDISVDLSDSRS